jgi:DNA-binding NarL/FixJ family response regulator
MGNPTTRPITILIVDDERTFGEALQLALRQEKDLKVIDVAVEGDTAMRVVDEQHPDVVIMDVAMPGMNGIEATRRIKEEDPDAQVLILSGHEDPLLLARAVQAGAVGLLRKTEAIVNVATSVRRAYRGESIHDQEEVDSAMRRLRHRRDADADAKRRLERLTPREQQILERMATGMSSDAIAKALNMSPHTLRTHMQNILTKLGVHSKMEALVIAIRHGAVSTVDLTSEDAAG